MTTFYKITSDVREAIIRPLLDPFSLLSFKRAWERKDIQKSDFSEKIIEAIVSHGISLVERYYEFIKHYNLYTMAAKTDRLDVLEYITKRKHCMWINASLAAARYGRLDQLIFMKDTDIGWQSGTIRAAVENGHIRILEYAYDHKYYFYIPNDIMDTAAEKGYLDIMRLIHVNQAYFSYSPVSKAAAAGQLESIKFLFGNGYRFEDVDVILAIRAGHLHIVEYFIENSRDILAEYLMAETARSGKLEILRYLHNKGFSWGENIYLNAIRQKHLNIIEYAHENGCPSSTNLCYLAATYGYMEALQYFHERNLPWGADVCEIAAEKGYLDVLKYAHKNGCPWSSRVCELALEHDHLYISQYVMEHGLE